MYYQKRGKYYSFIYYDPKVKRNMRLPSSSHPRILSEEEAIAFSNKWDAENDAVKVRIQKRLEWSKKYFDFNSLIDLFILTKKEEAPNTWKDYETHLRYHVFPFFLTKKQENNINLWHYHFEEFRDYLQSRSSVQNRGEGKTLAFSTMNNIINALNGFLDVMARRKFIETKITCRQFPSHLLKERSEIDVITKEKQDLIYSALRFRNPLSADFFLTSLHTGMRANEQFGLSLDDLFPDELESDFMKTALKPYHMKPYGFISLESQPSLRSNPRDENGHVPRKPLKSKRKIDSKNTRIIPIFDKKTYNTLAKLWNAQRENFKAKKYGSNLKDYLLFDGLHYSVYANDLRLVQESLKLDYIHSQHDTRHTYSTWLADKTGGNYTLMKMIIGHTEVRMTMRYVHINAKIKRQLKCKDRLMDSMELAL